DAKITLIMYVPNAEPELFEDCNTYIENYSQKTSPNSNLHFEARFIPVNSQEDFNDGLDKIIL
ncbi:MAG: hypothetical protein K6G10_12520, partial [Butyrivibrio sp.]|nr:hypothetical protein [Butyrivibrio sp.]